MTSKRPGPLQPTEDAGISNTLLQLYLNLEEGGRKLGAVRDHSCEMCFSGLAPLGLREPRYGQCFFHNTKAGVQDQRSTFHMAVQIGRQSCIGNKVRCRAAFVAVASNLTTGPGDPKRGVPVVANASLLFRGQLIRLQRYYRHRLESKLRFRGGEDSAGRRCFQGLRLC